MANRTFIDYSLSLHKRRVTLYFTVNFGAAGAPTLQVWDPVARSFSAATAQGWKGIKSLTRVSAGLYDVNLQDAYNQVLNADMVPVLAAGSFPAATELQLVTPNLNVNSATAPKIRIQLNNPAGNAATDPASGEQVQFYFDLSDSTAI